MEENVSEHLCFSNQLFFCEPGSMERAYIQIAASRHLDCLWTCWPGDRVHAPRLSRRTIFALHQQGAGECRSRSRHARASSQWHIIHVQRCRLGLSVSPLAESAALLRNSRHIDHHLQPWSSETRVVSGYIYCGRTLVYSRPRMSGLVSDGGRRQDDYEVKGRENVGA
jgi:hypothetical protein